MRALAKKANKTEKLKNSKGGHQIWTEIGELGALIRWDLVLFPCKGDVLPHCLWCGQRCQGAEGVDLRVSSCVARCFVSYFLRR